MKNKKILVFGVIIIIILGGLLMYFFKDKIFYKNFIRLDYTEIKEKINNKENFILCVSREKCSHCQDYKPKLKKVSNKYSIKIYYTDIDTYNDKDSKDFYKIISFDGATPTTIFFKDGEEKTTATRIEGDVSEEKIITKIKQNGFIN